RRSIRRRGPAPRAVRCSSTPIRRRAQARSAASPAREGETMGKLEGKRAFVTGAGGGIGRAIAEAFVREGARVGVVDVDGRLARAAAAALPDGRGTPLVSDVADRQAVFAAMAEFTGASGGLDVLVNNAVFFHYAPLVD